MAGNNFILIFLLITVINKAYAKEDEELLLINESFRIAADVHRANIKYFGFSSKDCSPIADVSQLINQLKTIRDGGRVNCLSGEPTGSIRVIPEVSNGDPISIREESSFEAIAPLSSISRTSDDSFNHSEVLEEYARKKRDYIPQEYDGLFDLVSKAYVRNLKKLFDN